MRGIVKLAVLAGLVYLGFEYGRPWIERLDEGSAAGGTAVSAEAGDDVATCLEWTRSASNALDGATTVMGTPPYDAAAWANLESRLLSQVGEARAACSCAHDACETANAALDAMEGIVGDYAAAVAGDGTLTDLARQYDEVHGLLATAQSQAR